MKAHLAKVSLALLSAAFLLGCQERGSEPVGPEGLGPQFDKPVDGEHRHGDDVDPDPITLTLADGMVTTTDLPVTVGQDSRKKLNVGNSDFVQDIKMNFLNPGDCFGFAATKSGKAPDDEEIAALVAELTSPVLVTSGFFTMQIDKTGLTTDGDATTDDRHLLLVERDGTFDDPTDGPTHGHTRIMLGSPFDQVGPVTVTRVSKDEFTFTGPVVVWAHGVGGGGGEKSNRIIACNGAVHSDGTLLPDPNKVTATINR